MRSTLHRYAGPGIVGLFGLGQSVSGFQSPAIGGALVVLALLWGLFYLYGRREDGESGKAQTPSQAFDAQIRAAHRRQRRAPTGPALVFREPVVTKGMLFQDALMGPWYGDVVTFQVANDGGEEARHVCADMRIVDLDENELRPPDRARWANDAPHPLPGVPSKHEISIPANGVAHALDSVVQNVNEYDVCWVCVDDGLRFQGVRREAFAVHAREFIVEMTVRGETGKVSPQAQRVKVALDFPSPRIELLG